MPGPTYSKRGAFLLLESGQPDQWSLSHAISQAISIALYEIPDMRPYETFAHEKARC
jgi:hypothetical protein